MRLLFAAIALSILGNPAPQKGPAPMHATGTFDVTLTPEQDAPTTPPNPGFARMRIAKQFHGGLDGTSAGQMLSATTETKGSAGYVAIETFSGTLDGHAGTFVLQHHATMDRGTPDLHIDIVPDSGTGALTGLTGSMDIDRTGGHHAYTFTYTLPS